MKCFKIVLVFLIAVLFSNCKTANLRFKLFNPPAVSLPEHAKQMAVVNRTIVDSTKKDKNIIEMVVSGEAFLGDKLGAEDCIFSFSQYMNNYGPVAAVVPQNHRLYGNIGGFHTDPLDWNTVTKICRETKSSILMSLEKFDTNSDAMIGAVTNGVNVMNSVLNGNGAQGSKDIRYHVSYGWILYDTLSKTIIYYYDDVVHEIARGVPVLAPLPTEAVKNTARFIGEREASKFNSTFYWVHREYYKKGKSTDFRIGFRRAAVNDWDGAIAIWQECVKSPKAKTAGRACYNIAIAYEVKGDLKEALRWAKKSYSDYGTKMAQEYVYLLERRINSGQ